MSGRFARRTGWDTSESDFAGAIRSARASGRALWDLTITNPTVCGFDYGALAPLSLSGSLVYDPDPLGKRSAREAVASYYDDHWCVVEAGHVVLTASTSEAYGYLFKLLCDPGGEVLVPQPSYPLLDYLAELHDVVLRPYPLFYDVGWWIDFATLERKIGANTRAIVVVHPNNPTGHITGAAERERLVELCARRGLTLIVDEVFLDYPVEEAGRIESFARLETEVLTFVLSGLSKVVALPQMKVAWVAALGPERLREEALRRLEVIADTFLSVNAPAQAALPAWLGGRGRIQEQIRGRLRENMEVLRGSGLAAGVTQAGWSSIVKVFGMEGKLLPALELLAEAEVVAHPGELYGIRDAGRFVLSLLTPAEIFRCGISRLAAFEEEKLEAFRGERGC